MPILNCFAPGGERPISKREIIEQLEKERSHLSRTLKSYEGRFRDSEDKEKQMLTAALGKEAKLKSYEALMESMQHEMKKSDVEDCMNLADQDQGQCLQAALKLLVQSNTASSLKLNEANSRINDLERELKAEKAVSEQLTRNNEVLLLRSESLDDEAKGLRSINEGQSQQLEILTTEMKAMGSRLESLEAQLAQKDQQARAATAELSSILSEHQTTHQTLKDVQRKLQAALGEAEVYRSESEGLKESLVSRDAEIERLSTSEAESKQSLAASTRKVSDLEARISSLVARCKVAEETACTAEAELSATRQLLSESSLATNALRLQVDEKSQELEEMCRRLISSSSSSLTASNKGDASLTANTLNGPSQDMEKKLVQASRSLAASALEHQETLSRLAQAQSDLNRKEKELEVLARRCEELDKSSISASLRLEELVTATSQLENLTLAHGRLEKDLEAKKELISSIARLSTAGGRAASVNSSGGAEADSHGELLQFYNEALKGESLKIKLRDAPLGLCGSLLSAVSESSNLKTLIVDLDSGARNGEHHWESMGIRTACLAAALSLNGSIRSVELTGWSWLGELGDGALPFLPLACPSPSSSSALTLITIDTKLFCAESASSLLDLVKRGLVDLKKPGGGKGTLRILSDNAVVDEWYGMALKSSLSGSPGLPLTISGDLCNSQMESHHVVQVMVILATCDRLKSLRLDGNKLGEGGVRLLCLGLSANSSIVELSLARNAIGAQGAKRLARAISEGSSNLRRIDVSNQRRELGVGTEALISSVLKRRLAIGSSLESGSSVEELDISGAPLSLTSVNLILSSLRQHTSAVKEKGAKTLSPLRIVARDSGLDATALKAMQSAAKEAGCTWVGN